MRPTKQLEETSEKGNWMGVLPGVKPVLCCDVRLLDRYARRRCLVSLLGCIGSFLLLRNFLGWMANFQNVPLETPATQGAEKQQSLSSNQEGNLWTLSR
jgi:hypothetical protein